jgi:hypothetical protein
MTEPDWATWWKEVSRRVTDSKGNRVKLTIDEIRSGTGCNRQNIDRAWWWELANYDVQPEKITESRRRDLNPRPAHYECAALPTELQRQPESSTTTSAL